MLNPFATSADDGHANRATGIIVWEINSSWHGFDHSAAYQNCITQLHRRPPLPDIVTLMAVGFWSNWQLANSNWPQQEQNQRQKDFGRETNQEKSKTKYEDAAEAAAVHSFW